MAWEIWQLSIRLPTPLLLRLDAPDALQRCQFVCRNLDNMYRQAPLFTTDFVVRCVVD